MNHTQFLKMVLATAAVIGLLSAAALGSTFQVIYNFSGPDGAFPFDAGNLVIDSNGNLFGTTLYGGTCGEGTLFQLSPNGSGGWTETVWYNFCGANGAYPTAAPAMPPTTEIIMESCQPDCVMGNTVFGGTGNAGVLFECFFGLSSCRSYPYASFTSAAHPYASPSWTVDDAFQGNEGPASVLFDGGPNGHGELYWGSYSPYDFCSVSGCADGANPASATVQDGSGNIWGTTSAGGSNSQGIVYEWLAYNCPDIRGDVQYCYNSPVLVQHNFTGGSTDGAFPVFATPALSQTCSQFGCQDVWGTTPFGGAFNETNGGYGTVFVINQLTGFNLVHSFDWFDGAWPYAGLTNLNGTFYGTTSSGGPYQRECCPLRFRGGRGTIYSLTNTGTLTTLHTFTGNDGALPYSGLVADTNGNLYGVTFEGGRYGYGVVYEITP